MSESELEVPWFVIVNDLVGGWAVSASDKPLSQHDHRVGEGELADFCSEEVARHIADLHNAHLARAVSEGTPGEAKENAK